MYLLGISDVSDINLKSLFGCLLAHSFNGLCSFWFVCVSPHNLFGFANHRKFLVLCILLFTLICLVQAVSLEFFLVFAIHRKFLFFCILFIYFWYFWFMQFSLNIHCEFSLFLYMFFWYAEVEPEVESFRRVGPLFCGCSGGGRDGGPCWWYFCVVSEYSFSVFFEILYMQSLL